MSVGESRTLTSRLPVFLFIFPFDLLLCIPAVSPRRSFFHYVLSIPHPLTLFSLFPLFSTVILFLIFIISSSLPHPSSHQRADGWVWWEKCKCQVVFLPGKMGFRANMTILALIKPQVGIKGVSLGSSQGLLGKRRVTLFASFQRMNYFVSDILIFPCHHLKSEMTEEPVLQKKFKNDTFLMWQPTSQSRLLQKALITYRRSTATFKYINKSRRLCFVHVNINTIHKTWDFLHSSQSTMQNITPVLLFDSFWLNPD